MYDSRLIKLRLGLWVDSGCVRKGAEMRYEEVADLVVRSAN